MYLVGKLTITCLIICALAQISHAKRPKDGTYPYTVAFAEWGGKSLGSKCTVIIKGDSIIILNDGSLTGGDTIEAGIIMKHKKTGQWIIGHTKKDRNAKEVGGCTDGPRVIDFKRRIFWTC
jgi:hypothetical protein